MRKAVILIGAGWFFGLTAPVQAPGQDCLATPEQRLITDKALFLIAAGTLFEETREIVDKTLGGSWPTMGPGQAGGLVPPDSLDAGFDRICSWLESLPREKRGEYQWAMRQWSESYRAVKLLTELLNVEGLGSAVAHLPETQGLFPRDPSVIAQQGPTVGGDLASGENKEVWYGLASYLASKERPERARVVSELLRLGVSFEGEW